jgi:hypothetical protein
LFNNTTGNFNTAVGSNALLSNTTGSSNSAVGYQAGYSNNADSGVQAFGTQALYSNTSGILNTAVGSISLYSNTTGSYNIAIGRSCLSSNSIGTNNVGVGGFSFAANTTGSFNAALGYASLNANTTGSNNSAFGYQSLASNTTGANNVAIGIQALASQTIATDNVAVGQYAGNSYTTNGSNTIVGANAGRFSTGSGNTFLGAISGYNMTTGSKNTILGRFDGNQGNLDIRTASNVIVLSDGDGNPAIVRNYFLNGATTWSALSGVTNIGLGGTASNYEGLLCLSGSSASNYGPGIRGSANGALGWSIGSYSWVINGTNYNYFACQAGGSNGVYLAAGATSWTAVSDETRKDIIEPITGGLAKVATLRTVIGKLKTDEEGIRRPYLIAQDVQKVLPEAVTEAEDKEGKVLGLSYTEVIPLLVNAIQELNAKVEAQALEIAQLKGK